MLWLNWKEDLQKGEKEILDLAGSGHGGKHSYDPVGCHLSCDDGPGDHEVLLSPVNVVAGGILPVLLCVFRLYLHWLLRPTGKDA